MSARISTRPAVPSVKVAPDKRRFAVGVLVAGRLDSIVRQRLSIQEARGFLRSYNGVEDDHVAVILCHPIRLPVPPKNGKGGAA